MAQQPHRIFNDSASGSAGLPEYVQPITVEAVFRKLIVDEIKAGRMTPRRRRRIVRYAARLGLSAVEAGELVAACREEALAGEDPDVRNHALRLVCPPAESRLEGLKLPLLVSGAVVLVGLLVIVLSR